MSKLTKVQDLLGDVVRKECEVEWKVILEGAFLLREAKAAADSVDAVDAFTANDLRFLVGKMRTTYRIAMETQEEDATVRSKQREDELTADLEKPLDPATKEELAVNWDIHQKWQPVPIHDGSAKVQESSDVRIPQRMRH